MPAVNFASSLFIQTFALHKYSTLFLSLLLIRCECPLCCLVTCFPLLKTASQIATKKKQTPSTRAGWALKTNQPLWNEILKSVRLASELLSEGFLI